MMKTVKACLLVAIMAAALLSACGKKNEDPIAQDKLIMDSEFNGPDKNWGTGNDARASRSITGGYYTVMNKDTSLYFSSTNALFNDTTDKTAIEASVKIARNTSHQNFHTFGGLSWNFKQNTHILNVFGYYNDGTFEIFGFDENNEFYDIKPTTPSSAIKKDDFNVLRIEMRGGQMYFFINGTQVYFTSALGYKLDVAGIEADISTTTTADYFKAWRLK